MVTGSTRSFTASFKLHVLRSATRWAAVLGAIALAACAARMYAADPSVAPADSCNTRVIISFSPGTRPMPDDHLVKDLARAARIKLAFVSTITPNLHVFTLSAVEADSACHDALERLRRDPRVRSVDLDARRKAQD